MNFPSFSLPATLLFRGGRSFPGLGLPESAGVSPSSRCAGGPWSAAGFGCCLCLALNAEPSGVGITAVAGSCLASASTDSGMVCSVPQARFYQQDA